MNTADSMPTRPYLLRFLGAYALALVAIALAAYALSLRGSSGAGAAALVAAAAFSMGKFVDAARRGPTPRERSALVWGSWALAMGLQLLIGVLLLAVRTPPGAVLLGVLLVGALYWLGLRFAYSDWMAARLLKGIARREAKQARRRGWR